MLKSRYEKPNLVSSGPNQQAHYYKLSFCPSVHLCICPSLQNYLYGIQPIVSPFSQSGSYLTYRVPLGKECAVIFNQGSKFKVKALPDVQNFLVWQIFSFFPHSIMLILHLYSSFSQRVCSDLEQSQRSRPYQTQYEKSMSNVQIICSLPFALFGSYLT